MRPIRVLPRRTRLVRQALIFEESLAHHCWFAGQGVAAPGTVNRHLVSVLILPTFSKCPGSQSRPKCRGAVSSPCPRPEATGLADELTTNTSSGRSHRVRLTKGGDGPLQAGTVQGGGLRLLGCLTGSRFLILRSVRERRVCGGDTAAHQRMCGSAWRRGVASFRGLRNAPAPRRASGVNAVTMQAFQRFVKALAGTIRGPQFRLNSSSIWR
jgi:hypothetical protein